MRDEYRRLTPIPCTECKYCQPCPNGVNIPTIFGFYNEAMMFNAHGYARYAYSNWMPGRAACGQVPGVRRVRGEVPAAYPDHRVAGEGRQ